MSLETQSPVSDFDVVAFSISFETDYLNMARMLQLSGIPVWSKERNRFSSARHHGRCGVVPQSGTDRRFYRRDRRRRRRDTCLSACRCDLRERVRRKRYCFRSPGSAADFTFRRFTMSIYNDDGTVFDYIPNENGVPRRVGRALAAVNPKEGTLRRALKRGEDRAGGVSCKPGHVLPFDGRLVARSRNGRPAACRDITRMFAGLPFLLGGLQLLSAACRSGKRYSRKGHANGVRKTNKIGLVSTAVCDHPEISTILRELRAMDYRISVSVSAA